MLADDTLREHAITLELDAFGWMVGPPGLEPGPTAVWPAALLDVVGDHVRTLDNGWEREGR